MRGPPDTEARISAMSAIGNCRSMFGAGWWVDGRGAVLQSAGLPFEEVLETRCSNTRDEVYFLSIRLIGLRCFFTICYMLVHACIFSCDRDAGSVGLCDTMAYLIRWEGISGTLILVAYLTDDPAPVSRLPSQACRPPSPSGGHTSLHLKPECQSSLNPVRPIN